MPNVTGIELFAGAGGMALGLSQAGIKLEVLIESNKHCCETLRQNNIDHDLGWQVCETDIRKIDFQDFGLDHIDIVSGGFPCQAFSSAGKRLGFADTRGTLFYEFARCVQAFQPELFLAENVTGLLTHDKGQTFAVILSVFESLGYRVMYQILDASRYGVAQKRKRLLIVGVRDDLDLSFAFPEPDGYITVLRDVLQDCPISPGAQYSPDKKYVLKLVPSGGCWVDLPDDIARAYLKKAYDSGGGKRGYARRLSWGKPAPTLTCSPCQKQTELCHPDETRPLTVREYARIQSFPDDWTFCGSLSAQYKQIGNAVPVELARRVGQCLIQMLE